MQSENTLNIFVC